MRLFKNPWDAIPASLALLHLAFVIAFALAWPHLDWGWRLAGGIFYTLSVGWSLDSVAHNFIHNKFFAAEPLNIAMSFVLSLTLGISQIMYEHIHWLHHSGNSDRKRADGTTLDPISVYRFGAEDKAEPVVPYVFKAFLRDDDPFTLARHIAVKHPRAARLALLEFWALMGFWSLLLVYDWRIVFFMAPFYYLGHCFSSLIAYYEHLGADPEQPSATGVSTYAPIYNLVFLNNGYHCEHHYRPKHHWARMQALRRKMESEGKLRDVRTIKTAHFFGFLEPSSWRIPTAAQK